MIVWKSPRKGPVTDTAIMDGLVSDGGRGYLLSDYYERVCHVTSGGKKTLLLGVTGPRRFCADFEYIPDQGLLLIPSLFDNRIHSYRYR